MKKTIVFIKLAVLLLGVSGANDAYGQGTKLSQFPLASGADINTTLVGVQNVSGTNVDQRYSLAQLAAYINDGITFDQALHNGNTTTITARFTDGSLNITDIDHGNIQLYAIGYHADLHAGTMTLYNGSGGYAQMTVGANPSLGMSNTAGTRVGYVQSPTITDNRFWRMPDSNGTVALLQNLTFTSSTLASGKIFVGNGSNIATAVSMSGDATISNAGVVIIDSAKFATRARVQKAIDSLNGVISGISGSADSFVFSTKAWRQKGIDSVMVLMSALPGYHPAGTPTPSYGTGAGTSPSGLTLSGNDIGGVVSFTTGTSIPANATVLTITFANAFASPPKSIIIQGADYNATLLFSSGSVYVTNITTTSFDIKEITNPIGYSIPYSWFYLVQP